MPLYIVGTSTFGTKGGYFLPGIFMGLLQIGWYSVATYFAADMVLKGLGFGEHAVSLFGEGGQFDVIFVGTAVIWGYLFAFLGAMGIKYVARIATFFPIVPIVMLIVGYGLGASQAESRPPVGLDLEVVEGIHTPVQVIAGGSFFVDSMTLRTRVEGSGREVLKKLRARSAFRLTGSTRPPIASVALASGLSAPIVVVT